MGTVPAVPNDVFVVSRIEGDSTIIITIGMNEYSVDKVELEGLMNPLVDDFDTLRHNLALALAISEIDMTDNEAIVRCINARTFKLYR